MDAEIWSHADIRNGRRLFMALSALIFVKELAVIGALTTGYPLLGVPMPPPSTVFLLPDAVRAAATLAFSLFLLWITLAGRRWAPISLGLLYLVASASAFLPVFSILVPPDGDSEVWSLANSLTGMAIGALFVFQPQLRAFSWSRAADRHAIPVPLDDGPTRRPMRQRRTMGEILVGLAGAVGSAMAVLVVLLLGALVYGFGDDLVRLLGF